MLGIHLFTVIRIRNSKSYMPQLPSAQKAVMMLHPADRHQCRSIEIRSKTTQQALKTIKPVYRTIWYTGLSFYKDMILAAEMLFPKGILTCLQHQNNFEAGQYVITSVIHRMVNRRNIFGDSLK